MTDRAPTDHEADRQPATPQLETPQTGTRYPPPPVPPQASPTTRSPILAAMLSIFPGLGNVYNGLYLRGITFFLICMGFIALAADTRPPEAVLLIFAVIFVWLFNLFDAFRQATLINYGYASDLETAARPRPSSWGSGGLVAGIAVFLLGLYGLLKDRFDIDLSLLVDYWYVLFMAFGAFLIVQAVRQQRNAEAGLGEEEEEDAESGQ